jgi:hypothetical protein
MCFKGNLLMKFKHALMTDIGNYRKMNQDNLAFVEKKTGEAFGIVCDGMGGHAHGALNLNYRLAGVKPIFATSLKDITQDDQQIIKLKNVDYFENVAVTNFIGDFEVAYAPDGYLVLTPLCANPDPKSINFTLLVDDKEYQFDALTDEAEYMDDINYDLPSDLINNDDNN